MKKDNLVGKKFGMLTVLCDSGKRTKNGTVVWKCRCKCGNTVLVAANNLKAKVHKTTSCGCARNERFKKDGRCSENPRLYRIYRAMIDRCENPNNNRYQYYGGRGITVCDEWKNDIFKFYEWAEKSGYSENLTIDRIRGAEGYSPENCRWADYNQQSENRSFCKFIEYNGESHCIAEWARILGINDATLRGRIKKGWPINKAFRK